MKAKQLLFIIAAVLLTACSKKDYRNVIPSNANLVVEVNLKDLADQMKLKNNEAVSAFKLMAPVLFSPKEGAKIYEYINEPENIGVDLEEPVYLFKDPSENTGLVMKINDKGQFDEFCDMLSRINIASKTKEKDDYFTGAIFEEIPFYYNDNLLLITLSDKGGLNASRKYAQALLSQDKENDFTTSVAYQQLESLNTGSFKIYSNLSLVPDDLAKKMTILLPKTSKKSDLEVTATADVTDGKISIDMKIFSKNEKIQKNIDEANKNLKNITCRYSNVPTCDPFLWVNMGVKGDWLLSKLKEDKEINESLFLMERGIDIEQIFRSIDGDLSAEFMADSSFDVENDSVTDNTLFNMRANVSNTSFLNDVDYWQESMKEYGMSMQSIGINKYSLNIDGDKLEWGVDDKDVYFTNLKNVNKPQTSPLAKYEKEMKECKAFLYLDILKLGFNSDDFSEVPGMEDWINNISALIIKMKSIDRIQLRLE